MELPTHRAGEGANRFLAAVSHDLRQPLQTLRMLNATLRRQVDEDERQETLRQVDRALNVMSDLVNAVLNVAKLESGTVLPVIESVAISDMFDDFRAQLATTAELKGLTVVVRTTGLRVRTDNVLLRQVVQNFISNAVRYTDAGQIVLLARPHGADRIEIVVEDTGLGIAQNDLATIFQDFVQIPRADDHCRGGVGLGLGTVRRIAVLLGLAIHVESTLGRGSRFSVTALADRTITPVARPLTRTQSAFAPAAHTVLFIDDDAAVRDATLFYLEKIEGYRVEAAASIDELTSILTRLARSPDIVVSDYQLGHGQFGSDAVRLVRKKFGDSVPAIMLTGDTSAIPGEVAAASATALLSKPVDVAVLAALMITMIAGPP